MYGRLLCNAVCVCVCVLISHSQTTILALLPVPKRVWNTSYTLFVLAAYPHRGVLWRNQPPEKRGSGQLPIIALVQLECNTVRGKFWRTVGNSSKFFPPIFINARVFNKLPTHSLNFSSPKTLEPLIHQNFPTYGN